LKYFFSLLLPFKKKAINWKNRSNVLHAIQILYQMKSFQTNLQQYSFIPKCPIISRDSFLFYTRERFVLKVADIFYPRPIYILFIDVIRSKIITCDIFESLIKVSEGHDCFFSSICTAEA
jgi:hypothetical protein